MNARGWVDRIDQVGIAGWAIDEDYPASPALVDIFVNGTFIGTVPASRYREDLVQVGRGGFCAFSMAFNGSIMPETREVEARVRGSDDRLPTSAPALAGPASSGGAGPNPWDRDQPMSYGGTWLSAQAYLRHLYGQITGNPHTHWLDYVLNRYIDSSAFNKTCLLLGATEGHMEIKLCDHGFRGRIVASDIAEKALARAHRRTLERGFTNVEHVCADLNGHDFGEKFDFIIAEGVLHHIKDLDGCLDRLLANLKPSGLLIAMEYTGAFRFQLPERQVRWINAALGVIPRKLRSLPGAMDGELPPSLSEQAIVHFVPPTVAEMLALDPSEAVSGFQLRELISSKFELVEEKPAGGSIMLYISSHFPFGEVDNDPFVEAWLQVLIAIEDTLNKTGLLPYDSLFFVAKPRLLHDR